MSWGSLKHFVGVSSDTPGVDDEELYHECLPRSALSSGLPPGRTILEEATGSLSLLLLASN